MKISFAGCGFLGVYHIGVAKCLVEKAPEFADSLEGYYGASAGSLVAVMMCCRVGHDGGPRFAKKMSDLIHSSWLGPFGKAFDPSGLIVRDLGRYLPPDAHKRASGKVAVSVTNCSTWPWRNMLLTEFNTRRELINAAAASCFIPVWSGWSMPKFRGKRVCDGGFTNNIPGSQDPDVITVCPFSGEADICPQDPCQLEHTIFATNTSFRLTTGNLQRLKESLFPPEWEKLEQLMAHGYQDALRFLHGRGLYLGSIPLPLTDPADDNEVTYTISYTIYQVLYELPLVTMTTDSTSHLPAVPPVRTPILRGVRDRSLWLWLLNIPTSMLYSLWRKCVKLLGSISAWQLPVLISLMKVLKLAMKEAGIWNEKHRMLLLTSSSEHSAVMFSQNALMPISSIQ